MQTMIDFIWNDEPKKKKSKITPETLTKGNKAVKSDSKRVSKQKWEQDYQKYKKGK